MGECILYGNGGSNPLNFKVVGGTSAPSSPKENTIWVNTSTAIHGWDFSATEPCRRSKNRNLLTYPYYHTTMTNNGITFTDNKDGTVTANGTSTAQARFRPFHSTVESGKIWLNPGTYFVSGCPSGGSKSTYLWEAFDADNNVTLAQDYGNGAKFTLAAGTHVRGSLIIQSGVTVSKQVWKPQIEKGSSATSFVKGDATGQVWFPTLDYIPNGFNALKSKEIAIYPVSPKQYISGAWANKTAKMYQGGSWVEYWRGHLLNGSTLPITPFGQLALNLAGHAQATAEMSAEKGGLYIYIPKVSSSYSKAYFLPKVNLTNYNTLTIKWQARGYRNAVGFVVEIETSGGTSQTFVACAELNNKGKELSEMTVSTVDVSGLGGEYIFCVTTAGSSSSNSNMYGELLLVEAVLS